MNESLDNPRNKRLETPIEPWEIVKMVDQYIADQLSELRECENRRVLDEPGIIGLHYLAAKIYARGVTDGEMSAGARAESRLSRAAALAIAGIGASDSDAARDFAGHYVAGLTRTELAVFLAETRPPEDDPYIRKEQRA